MAVYPLCIECGRRRTICEDVTGHKKHVRWTADVHFKRNGKRLRKTFILKEDADMQERHWQTDFERGTLIPSDTEQVSKTFEEVADEWWAMATGQNKIKDPNRAEIYRLRMFKQLFGSRPISSLTFQEGNKWLNDRLASGKAINTVNRDMKPLKWIMDYAVRVGYLKANPFKDIKNVKGGNVHERWMNQAEIEKLVEAAYTLKDPGLVDVIMVAVNTGFRKGNLERLTIKDIEGNKIVARKTKSGRPYYVPISQALLPILQKLSKTTVGPLLDTKKLDARFRNAARLAGFYAEKGNLDNVTIHTLRHTFAALYLKRGGDVYKLSKLLGHSSITITEKVYAHLCPKDIDAQAPLLGTSVKEDWIPKNVTYTETV